MHPLVAELHKFFQFLTCQDEASRVVWVGDKNSTNIKALNVSYRRDTYIYNTA